MDSEWIVDEDIDLNTHEDGPDQWKTPRRYCRRKGRDRNTTGSAQKVQKAPKLQVQIDVEEGKGDLLLHLIT